MTSIAIDFGSARTKVATFDNTVHRGGYSRVRPRDSLRDSQRSLRSTGGTNPIR